MKRKHYNPQKNVSAFMVGLKSSWNVLDPLDERPVLTDMKLSHSNPVKNIQLVGLARQRAVRESVDSIPLKWHVEIECQFFDGDKTYYKGAVFVGVGVLTDMDETYTETVEAIFAGANMKHYVTTQIKCTVMKNSKIKDQDFE